MEIRRNISRKMFYEKFVPIQFFILIWHLDNLNYMVLRIMLVRCEICWKYLQAFYTLKTKKILVVTALIFIKV